MITKLNQPEFRLKQSVPALVMMLFFIPCTLLTAQLPQYIVEPAPFSTRIYDEFSPVFYNGGIIFCSNLRDNSLAGYDSREGGLFRIFFVPQRAGRGRSFPKTFSKEISSGYNDGPATFSRDGHVIYYSRNTSIDNRLRDIADTSNKLGIFSAELTDGKWMHVKPFKYNDVRYTFTTPSLAPDGKRIYFSSDMPGGKGGMDLYYCDKCDSVWCPPVNMGPLVNTRGNESFPYAGEYGQVYFASDGLKGFGGKDLFYTRENNGTWVTPVHLDSAINSPADDFGLLMDSTGQNGFFSTNREKTDDIYAFHTAAVEFSRCDTMLERNYCFTFYDEQYHTIDTLPVRYLWDFGNHILTGTEVKYCFPGPGEYLVKLNIVDELTGDTIANRSAYHVKLEDPEQAYIYSPDTALVGETVRFDAGRTHLKNCVITDYYWDLGEGFRAGGPVITRAFDKEGAYFVKLGLLVTVQGQKAGEKVCVMKTMRIKGK